MRPRPFLLALAAALAAAGGGRAQPAPSPANFFSSRTLVYAEVRQPGPLAAEVRELFKGSVLGNAPMSLDRLRARADTPDQLRELATFGVVLSPEVAREVGRIKGAAVGVTGVSKSGEPEFVAVLLPGASNAPAFFLRAYLATERVRAIAKVEGVTLYQGYFALPRRPPQPGALADRVEHRGPVFAMMPGALFVGTPEAVKDAVRRARGKGDGDSLGGSKAFQEASKDAGNDPGLFAYANLSAVLDYLKAHEENAPGLDMIAGLINLKAFRSVAYSLTLRGGTLRYREMVRLNPNEKSPILEALPTKPANTELLHFAPGDSVAVAVLSNEGGDRRWSRLLEWLDAAAKLGGARGGLPSEGARGLEQALGIDFAKDVAGAVTTVGLAVGDVLHAPVRKVVVKGAGFESTSVSPQVPVVVLVQARDEQAAKKLSNLLPKVVAMMAGREGLHPTSKEVHGHKVHTLALGQHDALHYGRQGSVLILGPYEGPVAQALAAGADKKGWLARPGSAAVLEKLHEPVAAAVVEPAGLMLPFMVVGFASAAARAESVAVPAKAKEGPDGPAPKPAPPQAPKVTVTVEDGPAIRNKEAARAIKEVTAILAKGEPLVFSVTRTEDRIQAEATMGGLRRLVPRLTDFLVEMGLRQTAAARQQAERARREFEKAIELKKNR